MKDNEGTKDDYYRGRYIIALYDFETTEICFGVFTEAEDLARFLGTTMASVYCALSRTVNHCRGKKQVSIRTPMGRAKPYLIRMTNKELREARQ